MAWSNLEFSDALKKKYEIAGQQANADTTRADAAAQDVAQRQTLQQQADDAAMRRAELASKTSLQSQSLQNQGATDVANIGAQSRKEVANIGETGANYRTGLTTSTQTDIAGMEDRTKRAQLDQQNKQFTQSFGLDTAKAQESAIQGRAQLTTPEYGTPAFNPKTSAMESTVKRPAITGLAPSPLSTLGSGTSLSMESDDDLKKRRAALSMPLGQ